MSNMRMLAFSDFASYEGFMEIFDQHKPDLLLLAGDLTSDGRADWPHKALELIPSFRKKREKIVKRLGGAGVNEILKSRALHELELEYMQTPEYIEFGKTIHVEKFYEVLKHVSRSSKVFVVRGNWDDASEGDYDVERINSIDNCCEISGKLVTFHNTKILGLGYLETHFLRILKPLIEEVKDKVDIVLTHAEQSRLPLISQIQPQLIVRGHFGLGKYKVNGVPVVSPLYPPSYALIEAQKGVIKKVDFWIYCSKVQNWEKCNLSCSYTRRAFKIEKCKWPWLERTLEGCPLGFVNKRKLEEELRWDSPLPDKSKDEFIAEIIAHIRQLVIPKHWIWLSADARVRALSHFSDMRWIRKELKRFWQHTYPDLYYEHPKFLSEIEDEVTKKIRRMHEKMRACKIWLESLSTLEDLFVCP